MEIQKVKLTKEQIELLKTGNINYFANGDIYYHLPQYFKGSLSKNIFEVSFDKPKVIQDRDNKYKKQIEENI